MNPTSVSVAYSPSAVSTEFISRALDTWAHRHRVELEFSRPGKPTDTAYIESFNGKPRVECLGQNWFATIEEARAVLAAWRVEYNTDRPHSALGTLSPEAFVEAWTPTGTG